MTESAPETLPRKEGPVAAIDRFFGKLNNAIGFVVAVSLALFAVSISLDLGMRRVDLGNIPWLYEVIEYVLYGGVFLAAPWVLREGGHVRVDLLLTTIPRAAAIRLEQGLDVLGAFVCVVLVYYGWRAGFEAYLGDSRQFKTLIVSDWWLMAIFTVGLLLLAIEFLLRLGRTAESLAKDEDVTQKPGF